MKKIFATESEDALSGVPVNDVADLLSLAPARGKPTPAVLEGALRRIALANKAQKRRWSAFSLVGWGAAAVLGVLLLLNRTERQGDHSRRGTGTMPGYGDAASTGQGAEPAELEMPPGVGEGLVSPVLTNAKTEIRNSQRHIAVPNADRLKQDVERLRAAKQAREMASPHLSRTVVVEMTDPESKKEKQRVGQLQLTERVAESIAAGVAAEKIKDAAAEKNKESEVTAKAPLVLSGGDGSWNGEIVIESGLPNTGLLNLPAGTTVRHLDFPVKDAGRYRGLQNMGGGWFYDQFSNMLWRPTGTGNVYAGERAPEGFDVETFTPPGPQSSPDPKPAAPDTSPLLAEIEPDTGTDAPPIRGYPIYDETTGSGSIILQNLPEPEAGQAYQLWVYDSATPTPISIGMIPRNIANGERVWFDLGAPGVAPTSYKLTLESATGSSSPSGKVVLQGP